MVRRGKLTARPSPEKHRWKKPAHKVSHLYARVRDLQLNWEAWEEIINQINYSHANKQERPNLAHEMWCVE